MAKRYYSGIDVSAHTLEVAAAFIGQEIKQGSFKNDAHGHRALIRWLTKAGHKVQVCLEATGHYSLQIAFALHQHRHIKVMVVNPKAIAHYGHAHMQRAKTDPIDARLILDFAQRMPFVPWQPPPVEVLQLQGITRRVSQLKAERIRERNHLHARAHTPTTDPVAQDIKAHIQHLENRIQHLERKARALVESVSLLHQPFLRLCSIPGIGQTSALRIIAELSALPKDMTPPQWVAHAGLDPRPKESGKSVNLPRRISKTGNKHLRTALYMPALVACRRQENVKAFYDKLIAKGKKPLQAIVAVMRKLLHAIWGVWTYDQDFDGDKFYKIPA